MRFSHVITMRLYININGIKSDPPCKDENVQFTTITLKAFVRTSMNKISMFLVFV